jgi:hypothetical protein
MLGHAWRRGWRITLGLGTVLAALLAIARVGVLPLAFSVLGMWESRYGEDPCEHAIVARLPSPDGAWEARVDETACLYGMGVGYVVAEAHLVSTRDPARFDVLLGVDTGGHGDERPRLAWTAPGVLQVTVLNRFYLKVLTRRFDGVRVDLRFDPDNPAAKDAWLREHNLPRDPDR